MNELNLKPEHEQNLRTLAEYLIRGELKKGFNMNYFCVSGLHDDNSYVSSLSPGQHGCGTVACALGCGPDAGIIPDSYYEYGGYGSWLTYGETKFGLFFNSDAWNWCFSGDWEKVDNTPQGAGKRILQLLDQGLPEDWHDQLYPDFSDADELG